LIFFKNTVFYVSLFNRYWKLGISCWYILSEKFRVLLLHNEKTDGENPVNDPSIRKFYTCFPIPTLWSPIPCFWFRSQTKFRGRIPDPIYRVTNLQWFHQLHPYINKQLTIKQGNRNLSLKPCDFLTNLHVISGRSVVSHGIPWRVPSRAVSCKRNSLERHAILLLTDQGSTSFRYDTKTTQQQNTSNYALQQQQQQNCNGFGH